MYLNKIEWSIKIYPHYLFQENGRDIQTSPGRPRRPVHS